MALLDEIKQQQSENGIYNNYDGGRNGWGVLNGKLWTTPGANVPPDVLAEYQHMSPQEFSNAINQDAPGNGAGKGSMKEGILSALAAGGAFYGAGQGIGALSGSSAAPVADSIPTWMQPTAGGVADTGFGAGTTPALNGSVMGAPVAGAPFEAGQHAGSEISVCFAAWP